MPDAPAPTALPSQAARVLAFLAILVAGLCGGLIGYAVTDLQCAGDCGLQTGLGALAGAVLGAVGVAIISVLALRAMAEWPAVERRRAEELRGERE